MELGNTTIRFWGGLRSIGGTIVSIEYKGSRVIFDFGLAYNPATQIFDGQVKRREQSLLSDYIKLKMVPEMDGLYSKEDLKDHKDIKPAENSELQTAVIISHLHLDHIGAMGFLAPSIPVYMTRDSHRLYEALETIGEAVLGNKREYQACDYDQSFSIGEITITPLQLDHDILGACAFHIQSPDASFIYTGDLRLHGKYPERTDQFIEKVRGLNVDSLIMEGTTLRSVEDKPELPEPTRELPEGLLTESVIYEVTAEKLKTTNGMGIFTIYHRNIDRIAGMIQAGNSANRKTVLEPETAYLALHLTDERDFYVYISEQSDQQIKNNTVPPWKAKVFNEFKTIRYSTINENPSGYFVQNTYENILELFDLAVKGGVYIHSNGIPLGPFDPAYDNLLRILAHLDVEHAVVGTSGHAIPEHLQYIVNEIDPNVLIPLHSYNPERLLPKNGIQFLPEYNKTYSVKGSFIKEI